MKPTARLLLLCALTVALAPHALAFDPLGIVERGLRQVAPVEVQRAVRSLSQASSAILPPGVLVPDAANGQVVVYTRPGCGYCVRAIRHLDAKGVPHIEKNVMADPRADAEHKRIGGKGVPTMIAAGQVFHGYSPEYYDRAIARLPAGAGGAASATPAYPATSGTGAGPFAPGAALTASDGALRLLGAPQPEGITLGTLGRGTTLTYVGPARNGFVYVRAGQLEGWAEADQLTPIR